jgi:hypothetical protein
MYAFTHVCKNGRWEKGSAEVQYCTALDWRGHEVTF